MLTGNLGTPQSQPGNVQPGYFFTQGAAVWEGPFFPAVALEQGLSWNLVVGQGASVAPSVASQMANSDPNWWVFH